MNPLFTLRVLARAGIVRADSPRTAFRVVSALHRWGRGLAGGLAATAARDGTRTALIDDLGALTYAELNDRANRLANALADLGIAPGSGIGLLCRDSRYFVDGTIAAAKLGVDVVLLNTAHSGPQLRDVVAREGLRGLVYDGEFEGLLEGLPDDVLRVVGWPAEDGRQAGSGAGLPTVDELIERADPTARVPPEQPGRTILLTSGTTGTPKGARRPPEAPTDALVTYLNRIPFRSNEPFFVVAPMFHAWGFAHFGLAVLLGSTIVVRRRFDPAETLATMARHRVTAAAMVPVMAQRILALPAAERRAHDCSALRIITLGGSAIPGDLAVRLMDELGDVAYNTYGSTEVAIVSVAGPSDLRADPATAGKPVESSVVKLLDADGREVPHGEAGRIFVGAEASFEGYTGGGTKETIDGLMSTGDVGRFDASGRLRIEGRDDDMIVSGGENVFPSEVEDVISSLPGVAEAAAIGVEDEEFGHRLRAFVVRAPGASLDEDGVKAAVRAELARFKVPRDVVFVDELPRTSTGKVLKRELAAS